MSRLLNVRKSLSQHKFDAFLISSVSQISYLTDFSNFSREEREGYLLITKKNNYIFTDGRYTEAVKRQVKNCILVELGRGVSFPKALENIKKKEKIKVVGIEENDLKVSESHALLRAGLKMKGVSIDSLRVIKENWEIKNIQVAARLGDLTFNHIIKKLKSGMSEKEVSWEMEQFIKNHGGVLAFESIVAFGKNGSVPHHHTGGTRLGKKNGDFILLDFGAKVQGHCSDMTRTVSWGKASQEQKKMYQIVLGAQKKTEEYIEKNLNREVLASEADRMARDYIKEKGYSDIPHSVGHGIGLEVHELPHLSPRSKGVLRSGMVFSIEPGIYVPGFGGVRIEDIYVLEKKRLKRLTKAPKSFIEI